MTTRNLLITALVGTGLVVSGAVWATEEMSEAVDMNSLPEAVQKAIKDKAAGGAIVGVKREDDKNGKWNYEATVKKEGKELPTLHSSKFAPVPEPTIKVGIIGMTSAVLDLMKK